MGGRPFAVPRVACWSSASSSRGTAGRRSRPQPTEAPRASPAEAAAALTAFVEAVEARDGQALAQLAPPELPAADELLSGIAANVRSLDLAAVDARYVDQAGRRRPGRLVERRGRAHLARARLRRGAGAQRRGREVRAERRGTGHRGVRVVRRDGDAPAAVAPWPPVGLAVGRRPGDGGRLLERRRGLGGTTARGIDVVRRVLPDWSSPVVVEVPATAAAPDETLGADPGPTRIAAVTAPVGRPSTATGPVHVFVNPDVTDGLRRVGAQVVMSHGWSMSPPMRCASRSSRGCSRALPTTSRSVARACRTASPWDGHRGGQARRRTGCLPTAADFDTRARDLQARYEEAWLACRIIAERLGERGLVRSIAGWVSDAR